MSEIPKDDPRLENDDLNLPETDDKFAPDVDMLVSLNPKQKIYYLLGISVQGYTYEEIFDVRSNLPTGFTLAELRLLLPKLCDKFGKQSVAVHLRTGKDREGGTIVDPNPVATFDRLNQINHPVPVSSPEKSKLN